MSCEQHFAIHLQQVAAEPAVAARLGSGDGARAAEVLQTTFDIMRARATRLPRLADAAAEAACATYFADYRGRTRPDGRPLTPPSHGRARADGTPALPRDTAARYGYAMVQQAIAGARSGGPIPNETAALAQAHRRAGAAPSAAPPPSLIDPVSALPPAFVASAGAVPRFLVAANSHYALQRDSVDVRNWEAQRNTIVSRSTRAWADRSAGLPPTAWPALRAAQAAVRDSDSNNDPGAVRTLATQLVVAAGAPRCPDCQQFLPTTGTPAHVCPVQRLQTDTSLAAQSDALGCLLGMVADDTPAPDAPAAIGRLAQLLLPLTPDTETAAVLTSRVPGLGTPDVPLTAMQVATIEQRWAHTTRRVRPGIHVCRCGIPRMPPRIHVCPFNAPDIHQYPKETLRAAYTALYQRVGTLLAYGDAPPIALGEEADEIVRAVQECLPRDPTMSGHATTALDADLGTLQAACVWQEKYPSDMAAAADCVRAGERLQRTLAMHAAFPRPLAYTDPADLATRLDALRRDDLADLARWTPTDAAEAPLWQQVRHAMVGVALAAYRAETAAAPLIAAPSRTPAAPVDVATMDRWIVALRTEHDLIATIADHQRGDVYGGGSHAVPHRAQAARTLADMLVRVSTRPRLPPEPPRAPDLPPPPERPYHVWERPAGRLYVDTSDWVVTVYGDGERPAVGDPMVLLHARSAVDHTALADALAHATADAPQIWHCTCDSPTCDNHLVITDSWIVASRYAQEPPPSSIADRSQLAFTFPLRGDARADAISRFRAAAVAAMDGA